MKKVFAEQLLCFQSKYSNVPNKRTSPNKKLAVKVVKINKDMLPKKEYKLENFRSIACIGPKTIILHYGRIGS